MQEMRSEIRQILSGDRGDKKLSTHTPTVFADLLDSKLPPNELTEIRLQDEAVSIVGAALETTKWTLTVAFYYILADPTIYRKLRHELEAAIPDSSAIPSWSNLQKLPYLCACIEEALRLSYGTVQRSPRIAPSSSPFRYKSYTIPPGTYVSSDTYHMHHNESTFPHSHTYDPARWLGNPKGPDGVKQLSRYMVAFSKGTRVCLGMQLAYAEIFIVLATLIRRFQWDLCEGVEKEDVQFTRDYITVSQFARAGSPGTLELMKIFAARAKGWESRSEGIFLATTATLVTASPIHRIKGESDSHSSMNAGYPGMVFLTEFPTMSSLPAVRTHAPRKEAHLIPPNVLTATFDFGPGPVVHSSIAASTSTVASPLAMTFTTTTVSSTRTLTLSSTTSANLEAPSTVAILPTGTFVLPPSRPKDPPTFSPTCKIPDAGNPPPQGACYPGCDKNGDGFCSAADEAGLNPPIVPYPLHTGTRPVRAIVNTAVPSAKRQGGKDVLLAFGRMAGLEPDLVDGPPHTAPASPPVDKRQGGKDDLGAFGHGAGLEPDLVDGPPHTAPASPPVEKRQGGKDDWEAAGLGPGAKNIPRKALGLGFGPSLRIPRPSSRPHGKPDGLVGAKPTPINAIPPAASVPRPSHGIAAVQPTPVNGLPPAAAVPKPPHGIAAVQPTPVNALPPAAAVPKPPHGIAALQPTPVNVLPPAGAAVPIEEREASTPAGGFLGDSHPVGEYLDVPEQTYPQGGHTRGPMLIHPPRAVDVEARGQIKRRICFDGVRSWKCQVTCGSDDPATCVGDDHEA
ncbi:MAG: hypothetical protein Q9210_005827 [Variospora velana]